MTLSLIIFLRNEPQYHRPGFLERTQRVFGFTFLEDLRITAPELIDDYIIDNQKERLEPPTGPLGFPLEVEDVEPEVPNTLVNHDLRLNLVAQTVVLNLDAERQSAAQVLVFDVLSVCRDVYIAQNPDVGCGVDVEAYLLELLNGGLIANDCSIGRLHFLKTFPGDRNDFFCAGEKSGATGQHQ